MLLHYHRLFLLVNLLPSPKAWSEGIETLDVDKNSHNSLVPLICICVKKRNQKSHKRV